MLKQGLLKLAFTFLVFILNFVRLYQESSKNDTISTSFVSSTLWNLKKKKKENHSKPQHHNGLFVKGHTARTLLSFLVLVLNDLWHTLLICIYQGPKGENKIACSDLQMLITLCSFTPWLNLMLQGFSQMLERSGTNALLQFTVFRQAFPWSIRDWPQVQSRYEMKQPCVQKLESATGIPDWCVASSHAEGITNDQTIQIQKDFRCVRKQTKDPCLSYFPPPVWNIGFP